MYADLAWLQDPPANFRARLKALRADFNTGSDVEERLHELASARLDLNQLGQLASTVANYLATAPAAGPLARVRLGLIGSGTLGMIEPAIVASALRHRVLATVVGGDYGSAVRDALDPASAVRAAGLDLAMVALDHRTLGLDRPQLAPGAADAAVASACAMIDTMVDGLAASAPGGGTGRDRRPAARAAVRQPRRGRARLGHGASRGLQRAPRRPCADPTHRPRRHRPHRRAGRDRPLA